MGRRSTSSERLGFGPAAVIARIAGRLARASGHHADIAPGGVGAVRAGSRRRHLCNVVGMKVTTLDHLVLTVQSLDATVGLYKRVVGMAVSAFADRWVGI